MSQAMRKILKHTDVCQQSCARADMQAHARPHASASQDMRPRLLTQSCTDITPCRNVWPCRAEKRALNARALPRNSAVLASSRTTARSRASGCAARARCTGPGPAARVAIASLRSARTSKNDQSQSRIEAEDFVDKARRWTHPISPPDFTNL